MGSPKYRCRIPHSPGPDGPESPARSPRHVIVPEHLATRVDEYAAARVTSHVGYGRCSDGGMRLPIHKTA